jgi:putative Holliday junction resolvase
MHMHNNIEKARIFTIEELAASVRPGRPLMGIDPGTKIIGLAISDALQGIASPLESLKKRKFRDDAKHIGELAREHDCRALIIGLPLNMDGTQGPRAQSAMAFARNISQATGLPAFMQDERLSTVAAERILLEADCSRRRRAELIDKMAAAQILQSTLDRLAHLRR